MRGAVPCHFHDQGLYSTLKNATPERDKETVKIKINDEIHRAIQRGVELSGSKSAFARKANVAAATVGKYLSRQSHNIADDSWRKIYPLIEQFLPLHPSPPQNGGNEEEDMGDHKKNARGELTSEEKILLDAFAELPKQLRDDKLKEISELARRELRVKNRDLLMR